jgi:hypothetical protein
MVSGEKLKSMPRGYLYRRVRHFLLQGVAPCIGKTKMVKELQVSLIVKSEHGRDGIIIII